MWKYVFSVEEGERSLTQSATGLADLIYSATLNSLVGVYEVIFGGERTAEIYTEHIRLGAAGRCTIWSKVA